MQMKTWNKIKDFYLKNKVIVGLVVLLPLVLACNYSINVCYALLPLVLLFFATYTFSEMMCCVFFFMAFSSVSPFFTGMLVAFILVTLIKYIVDVKNKQRQVYKLPLLLSGVIFVLFTSIFYKVTIWGFYNWALGTGLLLGGYLIFAYRDKIDVKRCFYFLITGLIVSALLSGIVLLAKLEGYEVLPFDGVYHRAKFFTHHTNHLSMFTLFALSFLAFLFANSKVSSLKDAFCTKSSIIHILMFFALSVIGFLTMSKTFLIVYVLICVYLMLTLIFKLKTKSLYVIVPAVLVVAVLFVVFNEFVLKLIDRFTAYYTDGSLLSQILTNRDVVWSSYFKISTSSFARILFGAGMLSSGLGYNPHNVLLYLFYRVGVIGMLLLGVLVWAYFKESGAKVKLTFNNCLILFVFILLSMIEMILSDRFFLFLICGIILVCTTQEKTTNNQNQSESNQNL